MQVIPLSREEVENAKVTIDFFKIEGEGVDRLKALFSKYKGHRAKENYTEQTLDELISLKRFVGALEIKFNDDLVSFCGLSERNGWLVVTRWVRVKRINVPIMLGEVFPYIEKNLLEGKKGLVVTFNDYNKVLFDMIRADEAKSWKKIHTTEHVADTKIFLMAEEYHKRVRKLPEMVEHNYTPQWILYLPCKEDYVPFL